MLRATLRILAFPLLLSSLAAPPAQAAAPGIVLRKVADGLDDPLWVTAPSGDPRLFVVEQRGRIRILDHGRLLPRPFLDLTDRVRAGGERGLLSVAFHPRYAENGYLYVDYTDKPHGDTRIERYRVSRDPNLADKSSATMLMHIEQPFANHNGGEVMFGPDHFLWIGMGDGGSGGDPYGNAQNLGSLLGKLLRIDVDRGRPYAIPADNPFVHRAGARPEIWAYGLRNPWRYCFSPDGTTLVIADVGQDLWEEVDVAAAGAAGLNYGWNWLEGRHNFKRRADEVTGTVAPAIEYSHQDGCSVIGGFVYRGSAVPALRGWYLYSDYCARFVRGFRLDGGRAVEEHTWSIRAAGPVTSFGEDARGELYLTTGDGGLYQVVASQDRR